MRRLVVAFLVAFIVTLALGLTAEADAGIDGATNAYRQANGLSTLATSQTLTELAYARANEIDDVWAHDFWWWDASGCSGIGENLAYTTATDSDWPLRAWIASAAHHANIVGDWDIQGSAEVVISGTRYAVQLFGRDCGGGPAPAPAPAAPQPPVVAPQPPQAPPATPAPPPVVLLPDTAQPAP